MKVGGAFDTTQFYWHIVNTLEDDDFEDDVKDLLAWWDRCVSRFLHIVFCLIGLYDSRIFPANHEGLDHMPDYEAMDTDSLALLKAQKAAKRRVLGNATNQADH